VIAKPVTVRLELESHPENVALVRSALTGIAEALQLGEELISDLKTALSEACNNVALHAYDGGSGPMIVEVEAAADGISVAVIDRGSGITRISGGEDRMGLGLAVISALASSSEFRHPDGGGTEVRMWFARPEAASAAQLDGGLGDHRFHTAHSLDRAENEILVSFAPPSILRFVLGRMVQSLAASSHFSVTKISDLRIANEAIAGYIESATEDEVSVSVAIVTSIRRLTMQTGPMAAHDADTAREALAEVVDRLDPDEDHRLKFELLDSSREPVN
jgi:serine/threonine-protein kinase RsbW